MKRTLIKDIKLGEVNKVSGFIENIRNKRNKSNLDFLYYG